MQAISPECQVFTPHNIVVEVLNRVGYKKKLRGKKVFENSCGDGAFLVEVVDRYIVDCLKNGYTEDEISSGLEEDIVGAEIDAVHREKCIQNLNRITTKYNINSVKWNIMEIDVLKEPPNYKFQFIVGNPPYITYADLDENTRKYIRSNFQACSKGKPDYYYAFIELSISLLAKDGKLAYLIPNNIFKNKFAEKLRLYMRPYLSEIIDYTTEKLFDNRLTSSAIIICEGKEHSRVVKYIDKAKKQNYKLKKQDLKDKWIFKKIDEDGKSIEKRRFGDDFMAMCSIATLLNKVFIIKQYDENEDYILVDKYKIEKTILKEAVSPRSRLYERREMVIFPYKYKLNGELEKYKEEEFQNKFPEVKKYLEKHKQELTDRNSDASAQWFEFGRSQALRHLNQRKLMLSTLITGEVKVHELQPSQIPYAGICIYPKDKNTLEEAMKILKSDEFLTYVNAIGINANGKSMRITAKDVENFKYTV